MWRVEVNADEARRVRPALSDAHVRLKTADAVVKANEESRIDGLRAAAAVLALITLVALLFTAAIPTVQPGSPAAPRPPPAEA